MKASHLQSDHSCYLETSTHLSVLVHVIYLSRQTPLGLEDARKWL